jgi:hypothetical protein
MPPSLDGSLWLRTSCFRAEDDRPGPGRLISVNAFFGQVPPGGLPMTSRLPILKLCTFPRVANHPGRLRRFIKTLCIRA